MKINVYYKIVRGCELFDHSAAGRYRRPGGDTMTELEKLRIRAAALSASIDSQRFYYESLDKEIRNLRLENAILYKKIEEVQRENDYLVRENTQYMKLLSGNGEADK